MNKKFFPGANSGKGFFSRFEGIVPRSAPPHYTYVLKGGPGVGKSTLMKRALRRAEEKGYTVEEFRCASDVQSLDAVRIVELCTVLLDGTAPHSQDPVMPGISDEVADLGHFKNILEFKERREELYALHSANKAHYRTAYAYLGAAYSLKREALEIAKNAIDEARLNAFVKEQMGKYKDGTPRRLFARSATPSGIVDFTEELCLNNAFCLSGILGECALMYAERQLFCSSAELYYDFIVPECPRAVNTGERMLCIGEGDDLRAFASGDIRRAEELSREAERLSKKAVESLSGALSVHDEIEKLYRGYVDYDRVNEESEKLIKRIFEG